MDSLNRSTSAPAFYTTVNGSMVLSRVPTDMTFNRSSCNSAWEPYYEQRVFMPDYPYFKRWQCRANAYNEHFEMYNRQQNIQYEGKEPSSFNSFFLVA